MPITLATMMVGSLPSSFDLTSLTGSRFRAELPFGLPYIPDDTFNTEVRGRKAEVKFEFDVGRDGSAEALLRELRFQVGGAEAMRLYLTHARFTTYGRTAMTVTWSDAVDGPAEARSRWQAERAANAARQHSEFMAKIAAGGDPSAIFDQMWAEKENSGPESPTEILLDSTAAVNSVLAAHAFVLQDVNITPVEIGDVTRFEVTQYAGSAEAYRYTVYFGHGGSAVLSSGQSYDPTVKAKIEAVAARIETIPGFVSLFWRAREAGEGVDIRSGVYLLAIAVEAYATELLTLNGVSAADLEKMHGLMQKCALGFKSAGLDSIEKSASWSQATRDLFDEVRCMRNAIAHTGQTTFDVGGVTHVISTPREFQRWYVRCKDLLAEFEARALTTGRKPPSGLEYV